MKHEKLKINAIKDMLETVEKAIIYYKEREGINCEDVKNLLIEKRTLKEVLSILEC